MRPSRPARAGHRWLRAAAPAFLLLVAAACSGAGGDGRTAETVRPAYPDDGRLRLNMIQVVGTHNSYHVRPPEQVQRAMDQVVPGLSTFFDYEHVPLTEQLERLGVRQFELDVFADPEGGLFARRKAYAAAGLEEDAGIGELSRPGFKVLHVQEIDPESNCWTLKSCLRELVAWSDRNPGHVPIMVLIEMKQDPIPDPLSLGFVTPVPIGERELDALDREIREVVPRRKLLLPDDVRGGAATLEDAVLRKGWPTLGETRGRLMFALDNGGDLMNTYMRGHPSLRGRVLFVGGVDPGTPEAAFVKLNDPLESKERITRLVEDGYMVRTRTDTFPNADVTALRRQRDTAIASGAQWLSTDFPEPDTSRGHDYHVRLAGGRMVACNPVSAPRYCSAEDVENPRFLKTRGI